jgi:hypothetical protein
MKDEFPASVKVFLLWVVTAFHWVTESLPTLIAWGTFIYTVLQVYVFVRDKLPRKKNG